MTSTKPRTSSFSRSLSASSSVKTPGIKCGPNGVFFVSSGINDLDKILGGGFPLGSLVMVMEDPEAPHHMLLLRNFMSQGLVHNQPLLYASTSKDPRGFLGTLPSPSSSKDDKSRKSSPEEEKGLRIAWQYKKYFGENQQNFDGYGDGFCTDFDLRKPLERHFYSGQHVDCIGIKDFPDLRALQDRAATFLSQFPRTDSNVSSVGRIAIQSLCSPQCEFTSMEWDMLSFIKSLKNMLQSANAVAIITFPPPLLSPSFCKRWQHIADILLSIRAIPDEDKELAALLTGYQDMLGFLNVHKVARFNTQDELCVILFGWDAKLEAAAQKLQTFEAKKYSMDKNENLTSCLTNTQVVSSPKLLDIIQSEQNFQGISSIDLQGSLHFFYGP